MTRSFTKQESILFQHSDREDSDTIAAIAADYGDRLEKLTPGQRMDLIVSIIHRLEDRGAPMLCPRIITAHLDSMSNDTLCALIVATAEGLRADYKSDRKSEESSNA